MDSAPPSPSPSQEPTPAPPSPAPPPVPSPPASTEEPSRAPAPPEVASAPPASPVAASPTPSRRGSVYRPRPDKRTWKPWVFGGVMLALLTGLLYVRTLDLPWQEFRHDGGGFAVDFPDKPEVLTSLIEREGEKLVFQEMLYRTGWEDEFLGAGFVELGAEPTGDKLERMLSELVRDYLSKLSAGDPTAKLLDVKPWSFEGKPGRVARYSMRKETCVFSARWIVDGQKVFVLRTGVHSHREGINDARFVASFRLVVKK